MVPMKKKNFNDLDINKVRPRRFGVQLGTYQELADLFPMANSIKNRYKKETVVQVKVFNG